MGVFIRYHSSFIFLRILFFREKSLSSQIEEPQKKSGSPLFVARVIIVAIKPALRDSAARHACAGERVGRHGFRVRAQLYTGPVRC